MAGDVQIRSVNAEQWTEQTCCVKRSKEPSPHRYTTLSSVTVHTQRHFIRTTISLLRR